MSLPKAHPIVRPDNMSAADTITLDETARHRRRSRMVSDGGIEFMLDLPNARLLRHGEPLLLDDGRVIEVLAAPEELMAVTARDPRHLVVLAWQIGNRHLAAQIAEDRIVLRRDGVIADMLVGLGAKIDLFTGPFDPEGGAYGDAHGAHNHDHHHDVSHSHD
jgi:urease accessory protein